MSPRLLRPEVLRGNQAQPLLMSPIFLIHPSVLSPDPLLPRIHHSLRIALMLPLKAPQLLLDLVGLLLPTSPPQLQHGTASVGIPSPRSLQSQKGWISTTIPVSHTNTSGMRPRTSASVQHPTVPNSRRIAASTARSVTQDKVDDMLDPVCEPCPKAEEHFISIEVQPQGNKQTNRPLCPDCNN